MNHSTPQNLSYSVGGVLLTGALNRGDIDRVRQLIAAGVDINALDADGVPPLHRAIRRKHTEIVTLLLTTGANINRASVSGCTPLHEASIAGNDVLVRQLLSSGANVNAANMMKGTPLWYAVWYCNECCVLELINSGADVNPIAVDGNSLVKIAVLSGHHDILQHLIRANAQLERDTPSAIYAAFLNGHSSCFRELILAGVAPCQRELSEMQSIIVRTTCVMSTYTECAKMFVLSYDTRGVLPNHFIFLFSTTVLTLYVSWRRLCLDILHDNTLYIARITRDITGVALSYVFALDPCFCLYCLVYRQVNNVTVSASTTQKEQQHNTCVADYVSSTSSSSSKKTDYGRVF